MNIHNAIRNPHRHQNVNASPPKEFIESYKLIINNNTNFPTRTISPRISIIDLAFTSQNLGPFQVWDIPEKYALLSDDKFIGIQ